MSSSPKYSNVRVSGDASRILARSIAQANRRAQEAWEADRRRRQEQRLRREQAQIRSTAQMLRITIDQLRSEAKAQAIPLQVDGLSGRLDQYAGTDASDLADTRVALKALVRIERDLADARRHLEAVKLSRALDGVAGQLTAIHSEMKQINRSDSERFAPGQLSALERAVGAIQSDLATKRLDRAQKAVGMLREQWDGHWHRVRSAKAQFEHERTEAERAIAEITDRCSSLRAAPDVLRYVEADLARLEPDMKVLNTLLRGEQFANVHQQVQSLSTHLDDIVTTAQTKIAQVEKQKLVAERLITAVCSVRGILVAGYPQHEKDKPAVVRFQLVPRGILHVEITADGPIVVRAEGFKHEQAISPGGQVEKTCDDFVSWFEQVREAARAQGLEIDALSWGGEPSPERERARRTQRSTTHNTTATRNQGARR